MLIGVTGGIGTGKSLVARLLGELLPAIVFNSDEVSRRLLRKGETGYQEFVEVWGNRFLDENGEIDRVLLRTAVFDQQEIRQKLEKILHPLVRQELIKVKEKGGPDQILVAEVPLLFECGWQADFDKIVCVKAPPDAALTRVITRDSARGAEVEKIMSLQMDQDLKASQSDWIIDNGMTLRDTTLQVQKLVKIIHHLTGGGKVK